MSKKIIKMTLLSLFLFFNLGASSTHTVLPCTVEFPKAVKSIPHICVYYCGERFSCETHKASKRACFTLPVDKACTTFSILITEGMEYVSEDNTIQYLKINPKHSYKFYTLELVRAPKKRHRVPSEKNKSDKQEKDYWIISESTIEGDGKIPDDTIIILLNSDYVDHLEGTNGFELPTIFIKNDILTLAGSEKKLHDDSIELLLTSLDYNPLHSNAKMHTRQDKQKIIVAMAGV